MMSIAFSLLINLETSSGWSWVGVEVWFGIGIGIGIGVCWFDCARWESGSGKEKVIADCGGSYKLIYM